MMSILLTEAKLDELALDAVVRGAVFSAVDRQIQKPYIGRATAPDLGDVHALERANNAHHKSVQEHCGYLWLCWLCLFV